MSERVCLILTKNEEAFMPLFVGIGAKTFLAIKAKFGIFRISAFAYKGKH